MIVNFNKFNYEEQDLANQLLQAARKKGWDLGMQGFVLYGTLPDQTDPDVMTMRIQLKRSEGYMALYFNAEGQIMEELVITESRDRNEEFYT